MRHLLWVVLVIGLAATPAVAQLLGDLDFDGDVDFSDFVIFAQNFGKKGDPGQVDTLRITVYDTIRITVYDTVRTGPSVDVPPSVTTDSPAAGHEQLAMRFGSALSHISWHPYRDTLVVSLAGLPAIYRLDTSEIQMVSDIRQVSFPQWAPDGKTLVLANQEGIFRFDTETGQETTLVSDEVLSASLSAKGDIVYCPEGYGRIFVQLIDAVSRNQVFLTSIIAMDDDANIAWSHSGDKIAGATVPDAYTPMGQTQIWWMGHEDASRSTFFRQAGARSRSPAWSPGDDWIAFDSDHADLSKRSDLRVQDIYIKQFTSTGSSASEHRLTHDGGTAPTWSPAGDRIAFIRNSTELWIVDLQWQ